MPSRLQIKMPKDLVLQGVSASPGIAIGPGYLLGARRVQLSEQQIPRGDVKAELEAFEDARNKSFTQLAKLQTKAQTLPEEASEEIILLLEAQLAMLDESRLIRGTRERIDKDRVNAAWAVEMEIRGLEKSLAELNDRYIATRSSDVRDLGRRLQRNLTRQKMVALNDVPNGGIVLAEEITAGDTAFMNPDRFGGFASASGGKQSHAAILARSLNLPAVVGVEDLPETIDSEIVVILDGSEGQVILNPSAKTLAVYRSRQEDEMLANEALALKARLPAITRDSVTAKIWASVSREADIAPALEMGIEGIGLYRTEYLFMDQETLPDAETQYEKMAPIVKAMGGRPVTIRTMDVGADKPAPVIQRLQTREANPALGYRGIRLSLAQPELLIAQFEAILRLGALTPISIMLPMVTNVSEVQQAREILSETYARLSRKRKIQIAEIMPPMGMMVETPAAALQIEQFAELSDFFSIGSNDLTQYMLAVDRTNERVASMYDPMHPAVVDGFNRVIEAGLLHGRRVSLCGELAGDTDYTERLLRLGFRHLSTAPTNIPRLKQAVRDSVVLIETPTSVEGAV